MQSGEILFQYCTAAFGSNHSNYGPVLWGGALERIFQFSFIYENGYKIPASVGIAIDPGSESVTVIADSYLCGTAKIGRRKKTACRTYEIFIDHCIQHSGSGNLSAGAETFCKRYNGRRSKRIGAPERKING